jgi:hypothetical protein
MKSCHKSWGAKNVEPLEGYSGILVLGDLQVPINVPAVQTQPSRYGIKKFKVSRLRASTLTQWVTGTIGHQRNIIRRMTKCSVAVGKGQARSPS